MAKTANRNTVILDGITHVVQQGSGTAANIVDDISHSSLKVSRLRKSARLGWKRPSTLIKNDQFKTLVKEKSVRSLLETLVELKFGTHPNTSLQIANATDKSVGYVNEILSLRHFPSYVIDDMNIHQPKENVAPLNKFYTKRYMSMSHSKALNYARIHLSTSQFESFYKTYKQNLPSSTNSIKYAKVIIKQMQGV